MADAAQTVPGTHPQVRATSLQLQERWGMTWPGQSDGSSGLSIQTHLIWIIFNHFLVKDVAPKPLAPPFSSPILASFVFVRLQEPNLHGRASYWQFLHEASPCLGRKHVETYLFFENMVYEPLFFKVPRFRRFSWILFLIYCLSWLEMEEFVLVTRRFSATISVATLALFLRSEVTWMPKATGCTRRWLDERSLSPGKHSSIWRRPK